MTTVNERLLEIVEPLLVANALELFDLEIAGGKVIITVDRPGGADVGSIASLTRSVSRALDAHDVVPGAYTLEVSSPGLERRLRTPAHFSGAVGEEVAIKRIPGLDGERRVSGVLEHFDPESGVLSIRTAGSEADPETGTDLDAPIASITLGEIDKARTVFNWGAEKPVSPSRANTGQPTGKPAKKAPKDAKAKKKPATGATKTAKSTKTVKPAGAVTGDPSPVAPTDDSETTEKRATRS